MDLTQIRSFVAVARHAHLTRAAETLHLSQPALSAQIKALEEDLGAALFRRSPSGMLLTPSGRVLLERAENVMSAVQALRDTANGLKGSAHGRLKLGTVLDPATLRIGDLLTLAVEHYPELEIELHQVVSHEALVDLHSGSLDASFYFGVRPDRLETFPLREITYRVAIPVGWTRAGVAPTWDDLATRPWIVAPAPSSHRQLVLDAFRGRSAGPEHTIEADNESLILNLVESGLGATVLRDEIALASAGEGRVAILADAKLTTTLWLALARSQSSDPLLAGLVELIHEVWGAPAEALAA